MQNVKYKSKKKVNVQPKNARGYCRTIPKVDRSAVKRKANTLGVPKKKKYSKKNIGIQKKNECWKKYNGDEMEAECQVSWCKKVINCSDYHVGHDIAESKGGINDSDNLIPICSRCNLSMGNRFSIKEFSDTFHSAFDCSVKSKQSNKKLIKMKSIPCAVKEQVWLQRNGNVMKSSCYRCNKEITYMNYESSVSRLGFGVSTSRLGRFIPVCLDKKKCLLKKIR